MFDHLQELSYRDRSNNWSNIGFCEEIAHIKESIEVFLCTLSGALEMGVISMFLERETFGYRE